MINDDDSKDNVKKVLRQIDLALANKGIGGHQERLLRIYKTVMAVEKHSNCFVSKFQGEDRKEEHGNSFRTFDEVNKPSLNLHTDLHTKKVEFEFEDADPKKKNFKIGMDELLTFVENELVTLFPAGISGCPRFSLSKTASSLLITGKVQEGWLKIRLPMLVMASISASPLNQ